MRPLALTPAQVTALRPLLEALDAPRFVLIGAAALSVHVALERATEDIDLVFVASPDEYEPWFEQHGWHRSHRMVHRWILEDVFVDLLPATDDVLRAGHVEFRDGAIMSTAGLDLVLAHALRVPVATTELRIEVASLPALVVLKMAAWLDRPFEREKDLDDLMQVLRYALADDADCRWDDTHAVGASGLDHECQSAFYVGLEVGSVIAHAYVDLIGRFLAKAQNEDSSCFGRLAIAYRAFDDRAATMTRNTLRAFARGVRV